MTAQHFAMKAREHFKCFRWHYVSLLICITLYSWLPVLTYNRNTLLALLPIVLIAFLVTFDVEKDRRALLISIFGVAIPVLIFIFELAHADISKINTELSAIAAANDLNCRVTITALDELSNSQKLVEDAKLPALNYIPQTYVENISTIYVKYGAAFTTTVNQAIHDMLMFNQTHRVLMDAYTDAIATGAIGNNQILQNNLRANIDSLKEISKRIDTKFCKHKYVQQSLLATPMSS
jgi:hypothetical protein